MNVTLINYDPEAHIQLIFTKHTRLGLTPALLDEIRTWPQERIDEELAYIANTIRSSHEFTHYTFLIEDVSRAFTHQFVRTRTGSFAQQSMRVNHMTGFGFVCPTSLVGNEDVRWLLRDIETTYSVLLHDGVPPEDARSILPTNIATNIVARFSLRHLADLLNSRLGGRTQAEYRHVAQAMLDAVLAVHPWAEQFIFRDRGRDYFAELEAAIEAELGSDLVRKGKLLKIVDAMRGIK